MSCGTIVVECADEDSKRLVKEILERLTGSKYKVEEASSAQVITEMECWLEENPGTFDFDIFRSAIQKQSREKLIRLRHF